jgi:hypothetical protein
VEVYLHLFLTSALGWGDWATSRPGRFTPGEEDLSTHWKEAGWASEPVWTLCRRGKLFPLPGYKPRSCSPSPRHYTDYAIPVVYREVYSLCGIGVSNVSYSCLVSAPPSCDTLSILSSLPFVCDTKCYILSLHDTLIDRSCEAMLKTYTEKQGQQHVTDILFDPRLL